MHMSSWVTDIDLGEIKFDKPKAWKPDEDDFFDDNNENGGEGNKEEPTKPFYTTITQLDDEIEDRLEKLHMLFGNHEFRYHGTLSNGDSAPSVFLGATGTDAEISRMQKTIRASGFMNFVLEEIRYDVH